MKNLYDETLHVLEMNDKSFDDVVAIQNDTHAISIENFIEVAKKTNYDSDYGIAAVDTNLKVIGEDWWLERYEYDGAEWWVFKTLPRIKTNFKKIEKLVDDWSVDE